MFPDLRETRGPGPEARARASNGTARRRAAAQWFFFFAGRLKPWIISASRNPSNPPRTVPRARGVAFDGTRSRPITLRLTNRPKRKNQGRNRIPVKRKEQEMFGFLNLLTPDDRAELVGNILLLIVIAIPTAVVNAGVSADASPAHGGSSGKAPPPPAPSSAEQASDRKETRRDVRYQRAPPVKNRNKEGQEQCATTS